MVAWLLIGLILLAVYILFKFSSMRYEKFWTYILAGTLIFFVFTFISVTSKNNLNFSSFEGAVSGVKVYFSWLQGFGSNTARITGNIVNNFDWSGNVTESQE